MLNVTPRNPPSTATAPHSMMMTEDKLWNQGGFRNTRSAETARGTCTDKPTVANVGPAVSLLMMRSSAC